MEFYLILLLLSLIILINNVYTSALLPERDIRKLLTKRSSIDWLSSVVHENSTKYCNLCCVNLQGSSVSKLCGSHTLCKYPLGKSGPSCKGFIPIRFTFMEQETIVDAHNTIRNIVANGLELRGIAGSQPTAANIRVMEWNSELAAIAERWVAQCIYANDICRDLSRFPVGQNIARGDMGTSNEIGLIKKWQDEVLHFDRSNVISYKLSSAGRNKTSSYTQLVWADTYQIGCARAIFQKHKGSKVVYCSHLICNYGPTGNIPSQYVYKIGKPCSACPEGTSCSLNYNGLCVAEDIDEDTDINSVYIESNNKSIKKCDNCKIVIILAIFIYYIVSL